MTVEGTDSPADPAPEGPASARQLRPPVLSPFARLSLNALLMAAGTALLVWSLGHQGDADAIGRRVWSTTAGYVRGVAVIAVVDALLIGLALLVIGVPLVLPLMVLTFLGAFLPLVGAVLAGAVAALVALVTEGVLAAALVLVAITVIQQLEGTCSTRWWSAARSSSIRRPSWWCSPREVCSRASSAPLWRCPWSAGPLRT